MGGLPGDACGEGSRGRIRRSASPEEDQGASLNGERFDPLKIVQAFNHRGVEYVVIGGYAGELHAAAVPPTRDIDFTPVPRRRTSHGSRRCSPILTRGSAPRGYPKVFPSPTTLNHLPTLACGTSPAGSVSSTQLSARRERRLRGRGGWALGGGGGGGENIRRLVGGHFRGPGGRRPAKISPPSPRSKEGPPTNRTHPAGGKSSRWAAGGRGTHDQRLGRPAAWSAAARRHSPEKPGRPTERSVGQVAPT